MVDDEPDSHVNGRVDGRPQMPVPKWLAVVAIAAVFVGSLIESTRRSVRSAVATLRRWLH